MLRRISSLALTTAVLSTNGGTAFCLSQNAAATAPRIPVVEAPLTTKVAYKSLDLPLPQFNVNVPVACWFPQTRKGDDTADQTRNPTMIPSRPAKYEHRISVKRIGQLLAKWNFIPEFASRNFYLSPGSAMVVDGQDLDLPTTAPLVLLAHGYLGSRFDFSHLAERLASEGFVCMAAEYPESLSASYDRVEGLTRPDINDELLDTLPKNWKMKPTSYGIVGHSLGCGTVVEIGDEKWAKVCIAGFPRKRDGTPIEGNLLFLSSMNDGIVSRFGGKAAVPSDITMLEEASLERTISAGIPKRAALVFDRPDAPNHISFLSEGVNDAMIDLLSPLLPLAQSLNIPVLDFDRYRISRDSRQTAPAYQPLVIAYLKQQMKL